MVLEIRTYRVHAGAVDRFVAAIRDTVPLQERYGIRVVAFGASAVREDGHEEAYLVREFASLAERDAQHERFYGSDDWRRGPRDTIMSAIESYHTIVIEHASLVTAAGDRRPG